ncbi:hypothetical protein EDB80DRAFT_692125 [Ilyonectria destructans]|nr:hypothetical protein EDB80DRAFT_692125 [Ilyonectria destructans]
MNSTSVGATVTQQGERRSYHHCIAHGHWASDSGMPRVLWQHLRYNVQTTMAFSDPGSQEQGFAPKNPRSATLVMPNRIFPSQGHLFLGREAHFERQGRHVGFEPGTPSINHRLALEDEEAVSVVSDFFNVINLAQVTASTAETTR